MVRDFLLLSRMSRRRSSIDDAVVHHYSWGNLTNKGGLAHAFRFLVTTTSEGAPSFPAFWERWEPAGGSSSTWCPPFEHHFFLTAVHRPSARPSTFMRPFAKSPSTHPASVAVTVPGCSGHVPPNVSST